MFKKMNYDKMIKKGYNFFEKVVIHGRKKEKYRIVG